MATRASRLRSAIPAASGSPAQSSHSSSLAHSPTSKSPESRQVLTLPTGSCNYRDVGNPYTCGCVRFMLHVDPAPVQPNPASLLHAGPAPDRAWCYCGHHACFHNLTTPPSKHTQADYNAAMDDFAMPPPLPSSLPGGRCTPSFLQAQIATPTRSQTSPKRMAFTPGRSTSAHVPHQSPPQSHVHSRLQHSDTSHSASSGLRDIQASGLAVWLNDDDAIAAHAPATRVVRKSFGQYVQSTVQNPPESIPSTTDTPMDQHILADRALLNHVQTRQATITHASPHQVSAQDPQVVLDDNASATEVNTPSLMGTPALNGADATVASLKAGLDEFAKQFPSQGSSETQTASIDDLLKQLTALKAILMNTPNLASSLGTLNNRIDALECASFSYGPSEELLERLELFEGRLIEVEDKVDEINQRAPLEQRLPTKQTRHQYESSFTSSFAEDESPAARTFDRIETAETRLRTLQGSAILEAPTWIVQVVLLPWGRDLQGIWYAGDADTQAEDMGATQSHPAAAQATDGKGDYRMTPRACADRSIVYQRLKSRGFVKTFTFHDTSASSIASQIASMSAADLVPLRKIHKASRLQFLEYDELRNRDLWSVDSLNHDIVMKGLGGQLTLFVTEMTGYSQNRGGYNHTWQSLRELPRVNADDILGFAQPNSLVGEADALEACWAWNARLDPPLSIHSSFSAKANESLHSSFGSHPLSPEPTEPDDVQRSPDRLAESMSECSVRSADVQVVTTTTQVRLLPISPDSDQQLSLPPHARHTHRLASPFRRTISLPLVASETITENHPSTSKRNVASFDQATSICIDTHPLPDLAINQKRRRLSRTPEAAVMAWGLTPRRSREPPSPSHSMLDDPPTPARERGVSQAYATPFSHNMIASRQHGTVSRSASGCGTGSVASVGCDADIGANTDIGVDDDGQAAVSEDSEADGNDDEVDDDGEAWEGLIDDRDDMDVDDADGAAHVQRRMYAAHARQKEADDEDEDEGEEEEEEEEEDDEE